MIDFMALLHSFDSSTGFDQWDINGDGILNSQDCPFIPGSAAAKTWWFQVMEPSTQNQITDEMREKYGDQVVGAYEGRALVPGLSGEGQGDFLFLVKKLQVVHGYGEEAAQRIAGKVMYGLYGRV